MCVRERVPADKRNKLRTTLPSTAATGSPNAIDATAAEVYEPTPGGTEDGGNVDGTAAA